MNAGVLAFHGDFAEHIDVLRKLAVKAIEIRRRVDLEDIDHLIIPGGESTVMSRFLEEGGLGPLIKARAADGSLAVYGTCAGAILVSRRATGKNAPKTLGLLDITVERNAYGTQAQSFETTVSVKGLKGPLPVAFIRAPVITSVGKSVEILASHGGKSVLVKDGRILAGTFHPEIRGEQSIHRMFLAM